MGFADLVGFTALSRALPTRDLAEAISEFDPRARETVTDAGGRVIKLIGDEVMFVADEATAGCEIALRLVDVFHADELLPPVRDGLAWAETIRKRGTISDRSSISRLGDEAGPAGKRPRA